MADVRATRSVTGNSKPRVFPAPPAPSTTVRKKKPAKPATKGAKPTGVTKKKAPVKKSPAETKVGGNCRCALLPKNPRLQLTNCGCRSGLIR